MNLEQQIETALKRFDELRYEDKRAMILNTLDAVRQNPVDPHGAFPVWGVREARQELRAERKRAAKLSRDDTSHEVG